MPVRTRLRPPSGCQFAISRRHPGSPLTAIPVMAASPQGPVGTHLLAARMRPRHTALRPRQSLYRVEKEGGPPTPKRPAHCFLTYPNSPPLCGGENRKLMCGKKASRRHSSSGSRRNLNGFSAASVPLGRRPVLRRKKSFCRRRRHGLFRSRLDPQAHEQLREIFHAGPL